MKLLTVFIISIITCAFAASEEPKKLRTTSRSISALRDAINAAGGCNVNVCFAVDGSGSVTEGQFRRQLNFIQDIVNVIAGNPAEYAATQYGLRSYPISFLTKDLDQFVLDVDFAEFRNSIRTNIGGGIVWCHRQIRKRPGEANKIVVLSDGRNNLGGSPVRRANRVRRRGDGKVCAVGIGFFRNRNVLLRIAGGDPRLVLTVRDYLELADILEECLEQICGVKLL